MGENKRGNHRSNGPNSDNWDLDAVVRLACRAPSLPPTNGAPFARFVPPPPPSYNHFAAFQLLQSLALQHDVPDAMEWQLTPDQPLLTDPATVVGGGGSGQAISAPLPEDLPDSEEWDGKVVLWESPITMDDLFQELSDSEECNGKVVLWESPITVDDLFQELFDSQKLPQAHPAPAPQPSLPVPAPSVKTVPSSVGGDADGSSSRGTKRKNKDKEMTRVRNGPLRLDSWACRKYSECTVRSYVECCDADPNCHIISFQGFTRARITSVPRVKIPAVAAPPPSQSAMITAVGNPPQAPALLAFAPAKLSPSLNFSTVAQAPAAPPPLAMASVWDIPLAPSHLPASASASPPAESAWRWLMTTPLGAPPVGFDEDDLLGKLLEEADIKMTSAEDSAPVVTPDNESQDELVLPTPEELAPVYYGGVEENMHFPMPYEPAPGSSSAGSNNNLFPMPYYEPAPGSSSSTGSNNNLFPMAYMPAPGSSSTGSNNNLMMFSMPYEAAPGSSGGGSNSNPMFPMPYKQAPRRGGDGNTRTGVGAWTTAQVPPAPIANVADDDETLFLDRLRRRV